MTVSRLAALGLVVALSGCVAFGADWPPAPALTVTDDLKPGMMPPSVTAEPVKSGLWRCTISFHPDQPAEKVHLPGTFNNWSRTAMPLSGPDPDGVFRASIDLPAGVHQYKFLVDDEHWLPDPRNPDTMHDGHSGQNSVIRLGHVAHLRQSNAKVGDDNIELRAFLHQPTLPQYFQRLSQREALVRARTLAHDVERITVVPRGGAPVPLNPIDETALYTLWEGIMTLPEAGAGGGIVPYMFVLSDGSLRGSYPETYGVPVSQENIFHTPDWAKHAIWYQIMIDRFRNGDPSNDREPVRPWTSEWFTPSPWEGKDGQTFYKWYVFDRQYGGDLKGLMEKLPYIKDMGFTAIYLNPVFKAESHHKYNAETYLHIDDHFGVKGDYAKIADKEDHTDPSTWVWTETDKLFLDFIKQAHQHGLKVIIDGVFNHVGTAHPAFQDVLKHKQKSRYADWFDVTSWEPFEYKGWAGHDALPEFKKAPHGFASDHVKEHIFNVTRRWMDPDGDGDPSDGIDGWRLDVPNEVPEPFWVEWREVVKSINPDAYITGEIWERADMWLDGRHFDAVMNYEFSRAVVSWVFDVKWKISPSEFDRRLRELRMAYPREATLVLQNLMNSHDTDRVASMAHNPDRAYDHGNRVQDNGPNYDNSKPTSTEYQKVRLAAFIQMTYVGAPMVYYGDEVGMWGADDPTCRKPMLWDDLEPYEEPEENRVMPEHRAIYKEMIALRNAHPALRTGQFQTLLADDEQDVWAFLRRNDDEQLVVAINASDTPANAVIPLPHTAPEDWRGVFGHEGAVRATDGKLRVTVPAWSGVALHATAR